MTVHNQAKKGQIAKVVIMPGDPLRAEWVAKTFLQNVKQVNKIRAMYAYTGTYKGVEVSVMAHGMGIPSIGIYSQELYEYYDVDLIIRIGSTGTMSNDLRIKDVVLVEQTYSESTYADLIGVHPVNHVLKPTKEVNELITKVGKKMSIDVKEVPAYCSDLFYDNRSLEELQKITGAKTREMEAFGLFANAIALNKKAAVLLTVCGDRIRNEQMSSEERERGLKQMATLALESALEYIKGE